MEILKLKRLKLIFMGGITILTIYIIFSGCLESTNECKNTTDFKMKISSELEKSVVNGESEEKIDIILSLKNLNFNLNMPFEDIDLNKLDSKELSILRNSIYAKHGYIFFTKECSKYFSQFSWYTPLSKNIEEKLNDIDKENIKNIITLERKKETIIKSSKDHKDYSNNGKVNLFLKDNIKNETLYIYKEELITSEYNNKPKRIVLKINNNEVVFDSVWNDSVYVSVADFDNTDKDLDVYITETGTDIQTTTYIYKFDGIKLYQYGKFDHLCTYFLYDEKGNIYYWFNDSNKDEVDTCFNYKTKQSSTISDDNLKIRLNEYSVHLR